MKNYKEYHCGTLTYSFAALFGLFFWLLWGDFAWSMKDRAVGTVATLMVKSFDVSDFFYSLLVISFPSFTNLFLGPLISYYSDNHRGKFGRRIPYLAFTVPFLVIGMAGLGVTPKLASYLYNTLQITSISLNGMSIIIFGIFWVCFDFGNTLANALFTALVNDVVPAKLLGRFFSLFRAVSLGAGILFNYCLLEYAQTASMYIFLALALLYAVGFSMLLKNVKEGEYPPVDTLTKSQPHNPLKIIPFYFKECFSHPYYRLALLALPVATLASLPFNIYSLFHAIDLSISLKNVGKYLAYTYIVSFFLSYPLGMLADKFHPIRMGILSTAIYGVLAFVGAFMIKDELSFAIVLIAHGIIAGCFNTLTASYAPRLFPKAQFAQLNTAMWIINSLIWMVVPLILGKFLDYTGNNYNHMLLFGGFFSICGVCLLLIVYRYYIRFGGDLNYQAPSIQ